jgi:hypothetical protein
VPVAIDIITCPTWGARAPKADITPCGKSSRIIIHHTAGHHAEIDTPGSESREEAVRYARAIQNYHMDSNGWIDSGHNFLVCRNGLILQGRWGTVSQIENGKMVVSAHCPGQNTNVGIEHEHKGSEPMTAVQREASAQLIAWISWQYGRDKPLPLAPHGKYYATSCPANLIEDIPRLYNMARTILGGL